MNHPPREMPAEPCVLMIPKAVTMRPASGGAAGVCASVIAGPDSLGLLSFEQPDGKRWERQDTDVAGGTYPRSRCGARHRREDALATHLRMLDPRTALGYLVYIPR